MAVALLEKPSPVAWHQLTSSQTFWVMAQVGVLVGSAALQWFTNREAVKRMLQDSLGVKLAVGAVGFALVNFFVLVGGCFFLNHLAASRWEQRPGLLTASTLGLYAACFICLFLPTMFAILVGPNAVAIQRNLLIP